jgi:hypothetical protein
MARVDVRPSEFAAVVDRGVSGVERARDRAERTIGAVVVDEPAR